MSEKVDLSLVAIDDLIREAQSRCDSFVAGYRIKGIEDKNDFKLWYGENNWLDSVALASILHNDVINNWHGELSTLQRINDDGIL